MKDEKYREFQSGLIPVTRYPLIGVRMPQIRSLSKELLKSDWQVQLKDEYFEEVLLRGLCIGGCHFDWEKKKQMIEDYLPFIDNWAICDTFVSSLKEIRRHREDYFPFLQRCLLSDEEFLQRYALVVLLDHYLTDEYIDRLYTILKTQEFHGYYSKMAAAWLLSYLFIQYFDRTLEYVKNNTIDEFVYKKGIQKALDSYRLDQDQKKVLKELR